MRLYLSRPWKRNVTGWVVISICILRAHGKKGHGAKFICPITNLQQHLLAILYVDDTDILHIDLTKDKSINNVHTAIQDSMSSWGNLLMATGGTLQPNKCFYSIISFEWINGEWKYANKLRLSEHHSATAKWTQWTDKPQKSNSCRQDIGGNDLSRWQQCSKHTDDAG